MSFMGWSCSLGVAPPCVIVVSIIRRVLIPPFLTLDFTRRRYRARLDTLVWLISQLLASINTPSETVCLHLLIAALFSNHYLTVHCHSNL